MFENQVTKALRALANSFGTLPEASLMDVLEQFNAGFKTGYEWPDIWENSRPGGPYIRGGGYHNCCEKQYPNHENCKTCTATTQSKVENTAWLKGWDVGHGKKLAEGRSNPPRT